MADVYTSTQDAAERLGIGAHAVRARLKSGTLRGKKQGREHMVLESDLPPKRGKRPPSEPPQRIEMESDPGDTIPDYGESRARVEYWKAKAAELQYRKEAGELVDAVSVSAAYTDEATTCREKLRLVPDRLQSRSDLSTKALALLRELIDEALEDLGRGAPG